MKKLFTGMLALGVLLMGMASLAQAQSGAAAPTNISVTNYPYAGNATSATINGYTVTVYRPQSNTAIADGTAFTPFTGHSVAYNSGVTLQPIASLMGANDLVDATLASVMNGYAGLSTLVTASSSGRAFIKANSTWNSQLDSNFDDLFTPGPMAFNTFGNTFVLSSYVVPGSAMVGHTPGNLAVYKFIPDLPTVNNRNTVQRYTLRTTTNTITGTTDGEVWFTTDNTGRTLQNANSQFSTTSSYYMWVVLKDGGKLDLDGAANGVVIDPPTISPAPSSGSSDSGCVYNPAAGFSLEWLLLVLPALGAVVARIRRK